MPLRPILHVLLILTLVLNGMGVAMARARPLQATVQAQPTHAGPPCHAMADDASTDDRMQQADTGPFMPYHECGGTDCRCACLHAATLPMPLPLPPSPGLRVAERAAMAVGSRAPPSLALHLRPPIRTA